MYYFLSLLIGVLSLAVLPHISSVHADARCTACSCVFGYGTCSCNSAPTCGIGYDDCVIEPLGGCELYYTECTSGDTRCCTTGAGFEGQQVCNGGYWGTCIGCNTNQCESGSCTHAECSEGERACCTTLSGRAGLKVCEGTNWGTCHACNYDNGYCWDGSCRCNADCSCASNTCTGSTCDDGCGGTCAGTKTCCSSEGQSCTTNSNCCSGVCSNGICTSECPYTAKTPYCFDSYSPAQMWYCENRRKTTYIGVCGFGCNANRTSCNEPAYCENWCDNDNCPAPQMRIYCWTDRTKTVEIPAYFDRTPPIVPICCNNLTYCNGSGCNGFLVPTPFCHPNTRTCNGDTIDPTCRSRYGSAAPYEWIDNCGGISCLSDTCTPVSTPAPGTPAPTTCVPDCSCAANTCIGQTCTDPNCNGICNGSRDCSVTLTATAKYFATVPANCSDITNPAQGNYLYPVTFTMNGSPSSLSSKQLISPNPNVSWTNVQIGTYNIVSAPPPSPEYQYVTTCWTKSDGDSGQASSITFSPTEIGVTGNFFVAFGPPGPWHQTREGDVYSGGELQTYIPSTVPAANRLYSLLGAGGTAGVISAGSLSVVPTPAWRVTNQTNPAQNFYASYRRKAATTTRTPLPAGTVSSFPASSTVYTTTGDLTFGNGSTLTVPDGVSVVYLVDGNVTITQPLTLANPNTSFLAIIARGTLLTA